MYRPVIKLYTLSGNELTFSDGEIGIIEVDGIKFAPVTLAKLGETPSLVLTTHREKDSCIFHRYGLLDKNPNHFIDLISRLTGEYWELNRKDE